MNKLNVICTRLFCANVNAQFLIRNVAKSSRHLSTNVPASVDCTNAQSATRIGKRSIQDLTPEEAKKLKVLKLEFDVFLSQGMQLPSVMNDEHWLHVLEHCQSFNGRKGYYNHLFKIEMKTISEKAKTQINIQKQLEKRAEIERLHAEGLTEKFKNSFMLFLQEKTTNTFHYNKIFWQMANGGQKLVFDFSYEDEMSYVELTELNKQLLGSHGLNKLLKEPFIFHFCNLNPNGTTYEKLKTSIPNLDTAPLLVSFGSYLDHYPKNRLVYLTPDAADTLTYDPDDIYIIGSIVDKSTQSPLSLAKAKREGIRMAKFPLDRYVKWRQGQKALPLNQVVDILSKVKASGNWVEALSTSLPTRKFVSVSDEHKEDKKKFKSKHFKTRPQHKFSH